jgi:hypothetical protein
LSASFLNFLIDRHLSVSRMVTFHVARVVIRGRTTREQIVMADETHAVSEEMQMVVLARAAHQRFRRGIDVSAHGASLDRLEGGPLHLLNLGQEIDELAIGLAENGHAGNIADIAVIIAPRIERQHVALLPRLRRGRAIMAGAGGDQAILEGEATAGLQFASFMVTGVDAR